ncbi:carboxylate--amine ligase/circularly permuted type 2 ATP-grasp protein [Actinomadura atramentaria]|uniref:carboxylate--amine ligase/circularly permuted type 2 ATP-grasp protein n=1 Tax=Actinomadura atramentaria TaxID=1990 RepID=UPI000525713C|nr:carboxylate--amine ligase/circularly permuted type 2 ATP-grasp protein [Actinomadura atramentaria]
MDAQAEETAVGVEEEFHTVDLETRRLRPRADRLLRRLPGERFGEELQRSVVETNSRPYLKLVDLAEDLTALRRGVVTEAEPLGLGVVAAGTVPEADLDALDVTPDPRYEHMLGEYQALAREQLICGAQVHVEVADRERAVAVAQRLAHRMPVLLALSASSPYWRGDDTGYASYRTLLWSRWPTAGPVGSFASAAEYDALLEDLQRSGVISDPGMLYFDVRPSAHVPTVELRVCDACPRVEDVVLLAGLFRAMVAEELAALDAGRPPVPIRPELARALNWRAARSGLEGELVDPVERTPVPAPVHVRRVLDELRPALERFGDWELVAELAGAAVESGGSAARQRAAFNGGGFRRVVDLLLDETREQTGSLAGAGFGRPRVESMLAGYAAEDDEAVLFDGTARGPYGLLMDAFDRIGADGLRERERERDAVQRRLGMTFQVDGDEERLFPVDVVPRLVAADDWAPLRAGLVQRVRALEAFLRDAYGKRAAVADGIVPAWVLDDAPGLRAEGSLVPAGAVRCAVAGVDLVRDGAGHWSVLEDNLRVPSGIGYALANRRLIARVLPELTRALPSASATRAIGALRAALAPEDGGAALLTSGPDDSAYFEHRLLADEMGVPLLTPDALRADADGVHADGRRVAAIYRRIAEDELFGADGADGRPIGPGLRAALESGAVRLANAPGNGVGDDKALYAFVPALIRYYLDEEPLLGGVRTYLCRDAEQCARVLDEIADLVVKPVDGQGGLGVLVGPDASPAELDEARDRIRAEPARWIAQDPVTLSTHPTFEDGRLRPRALDLRAFVVQSPAGADVLPLALSRVAPEGSRVVNSTRGGGSKDTWLLRS